MRRLAKPATSAGRAADHFAAWFPYVAPGFCALWFGGVLLQPADTFSTARSFDGMRTLGTENQWGVCMLAIGTIDLLAGWLHRQLAVSTAILVCIAFGFVAGSMMYGAGATQTGPGAYAIYAIIAGCAFIKR